MGRFKEFIRERKEFVVLIVLTVLVMGYYFAIDRSPPSGDEARHLYISLSLYEVLVQLPPHLINTITKIFPSYPPGYYLLTQPFWLIFGKQPPIVIFSINLVLMLLIVVGTAMTTHHLFKNRQAAFASGLLVLSYPLLAIFSHDYYNDFALPAFTILFIWSVVADDGKARPSNCVVAGIVAGLGMLMKWTYFLFIIGPAIYWLIKVNRSRRSRRFGNLAIGLLVAALFTASWYIPHSEYVFSHMEQTQESTAILHESERLFTISNFFRLLNNYSWYLSPPLFLAMIAAVAGLALGHLKRLGMFALWLGIPYLFFTFIHSKSPKHTLSLMPVIAVLTAGGFLILSTKIRGVHFLKKFSLPVIVGILGFTQLLLGLLGGPYWGLNRYTLSPEEDKWQVKKVVQRVMEQSRAHEQQSPLMMVLSLEDHTHATIFQYYATLLSHDNIEVRITGLVEDEELYHSLPLLDYVYFKPGSHERFSNIGIATNYEHAEQFILENRELFTSFYKPLLQVQTPTGESILFWRDLSMNQVKSMLEIYKRALLLHPDDPILYYTLGKEYSKIGQTELEIKCYKKAKTLIEESPDLRKKNIHLLGEIYLQLGETARAEKAFLEHLEKFPKNVHSMLYLARIYQEMNQYDLAERYFKEAIDLRPQYLVSSRRLGELYIKQKRYNEAEEIFRGILKSAPANTDTNKLLMDVAIAQKEWERALEYAETCYELTQDPLYLFKQANIYEILRMPDKALKLYNKLLSLNLTSEHEEQVKERIEIIEGKVP